MTEARNLYFEAVEARTQAQADNYFNRLVHEVMDSKESLRRDPDYAKERVVANLCYVAGYYGEDTRKRVGQLYSHRSPYRG